MDLKLSSVKKLSLCCTSEKVPSKARPEKICSKTVKKRRNHKNMTREETHLNIYLDGILREFYICLYSNSNLPCRGKNFSSCGVSSVPLQINPAALWINHIVIKNCCQQQDKSYRLDKSDRIGIETCPRFI